VARDGGTAESREQRVARDGATAGRQRAESGSGRRDGGTAESREQRVRSRAESREGGRELECREGGRELELLACFVLENGLRKFFP
jgi:hypothetical protein